MLARYRIERGRKIEDLPPRLRAGVRMDTRKHTKHCLRPAPELVARFQDDYSDAAWEEFAREYEELLAARFREDRTPIDRLRDLARDADVFIGCSCPTAKNPDVNHCHTVLALRFMKARYPELAVELPAGGKTGDEGRS